MFSGSNTPLYMCLPILYSPLHMFLGYCVPPVPMIPAPMFPLFLYFNIHCSHYHKPFANVSTQHDRRAGLCLGLRFSVLVTVAQLVLGLD